jgi:hypothetical protein
MEWETPRDEHQRAHIMQCLMMSAEKIENPDLKFRANNWPTAAYANYWAAKKILRVDK